VDAQVLLRSAVDPRYLDPRFPVYCPHKAQKVRFSATLADFWATGVQHQASTPWSLALHAVRLSTTGGEPKFPPSITSVGSDTMRHLMSMWIVGFQDHHPGVKGDLDSPGSGEAADALLSRRAVIVPMSRKMTKDEVERFREKRKYERFSATLAEFWATGVQHQAGTAWMLALHSARLSTSVGEPYEPTGLVVGFDGVAVYVHKENPIQGLTLRQLESVFAISRGGGAEVCTWGDLDPESERPNEPIRLYGRNPRSGTHDFFKERALGKGEYKKNVEAQLSSSAVVEHVASARYAIGYSGIGYKMPGVRAVPVARDDRAEKVELASVTVSTEEYPLSRPLYLYVDKRPGEPLDPLPAEFLRFVYSREGQRVVLEAGEFPVTPAEALKALKSLGLEP
jgi:phosphate transport system substrate-binding protein